MVRRRRKLLGSIKPEACCPHCPASGYCYGHYKKSPTLTVRYYKCKRCHKTWQVEVSITLRAIIWRGPRGERIREPLDPS